ncbi:MAG: hypothetical protein OEY51_09240 [Cyclobacteriaceae bacterium]|nr:hypothetical protein [Cyclobacteriaceae bacterium]
MAVKGKKSAGFQCMKATSWVLLVLMGGACTIEKKVCPAYQSAFIFDTTALKKKFSYFINDTPKIYEVSKDKFLLIEPMTYRQKLASFRTIEMLPIYPVIPDSLQFTGDGEMTAEMDVVDSTGTAATTIHPGLIGPFNVEQENYMYYFRKLLVLPDVRESQQKDAPRQTYSKKKVKKKRKKDKVTETPGEEEIVSETEEVPTERKRLKGKRKEDTSEDKAVPPAETKPAEEKPAEEQPGDSNGDGF